MWVDPYDPEVMSYITTGAVDQAFELPEPGAFYTVEASIATAETVLSGLTGYRIHPSGQAVEDFRTSPFVHRLSVGKRPLLTVVSAVVLENPDFGIEVGTFTVSGNNVYFNNGAVSNNIARACFGLANVTMRLTYTYGDTITPAARQALLDFARQLWLAVTPEAEGVCELPERVTSVSREGLSYTLLDPMTYIDKGHTGIPRIDLWLNSVNPVNARAYSGVYTPDSPIGTARIVTSNLPVS